MRKVVLDTETTGLSPEDGDRVVEIGCVELMDHVLTGEQFHCYVNPERGMPVEAYRVHGLSEEFLAEHPTFEGHAEAFLAFAGESPLVIHNAAFDVGFLNMELGRLGLAELSTDRIEDTLPMARQRYPGQRCDLDSLCKRLEVDASQRQQHGALTDALLLARVYIAMHGEHQRGFTFSRKETAPNAQPRVGRPAREHAASAQELEQHQAFLNKLRNPLWSA